MRVPGRAALRPLLPLPLLPLLLLQLAAAMPRCGAPTESAVPSAQQFAVVLSGSPKTYVPNQLYRVSVEGRREGDVRRKFMGFVLTVEAEEDGVGRNKPVGRFQLYPDALAKFDERCANTVTHANLLPSAEVAINWLAPPEGSGCVVFRAAVQENSHKWYADELMGDSLTQKVCEDRQENMDEQSEINPKCCACEEAKYEVTFEGLWSRHTHPKDFPADSWVTRFSDVIGASHDIEYRFWEYNGQASEGLRQVAERGTTRALETELKAQSEHIRTIIKARGISYPNVTGKTFAVFRVDQKNHLMSLVSMIDPSPDWIVGVSGLELCLANCSWVDHVQLNLYPFDAGTDSGITYIAPDQPTVPQEPIRKMSSSFPNNEASPFFDSSGEPMKPMARLSLVRQRLYEKTCELSGGQAMPEDVDSESNYRASTSSDQFGGMQPVSYLRGTPDGWAGQGGQDGGYGGYGGYGGGQGGGPAAQTLSTVVTGVQGDVVDCRMSDWSRWGPCDATCGVAHRTKQRTILVHPQNGGRACEKKLLITKRCTRIPPCAGSLVRAEEGPGEDADSAWGGYPLADNDCVMSEWSEWSRCTTTCGINAQQIRSRKILRDPGPGGRQCGPRSEVRSCMLLPCPR